MLILLSLSAIFNTESSLYELKTIFCTQYDGILIMYPHSKFHISRLN